MTMGVFGRTRSISAANSDPSKRPGWCSSTTASTGRDIKSRRPSGALVAVTNSYPLSFNKLSWAGSRCIHNNVLLIGEGQHHKQKKTRPRDRVFQQPQIFLN